MKNLYVIRGVSGSGKTTFAKTLYEGMPSSDRIHVETDDFFMKDGEYVFELNKLGTAHRWSEEQVKLSMENGVGNIIVSDTFTREKDLNPYIDMAKVCGYNITFLVVENRRGGKDVHNVPSFVLDKQAKSLKNSIKLI